LRLCAKTIFFRPILTTSCAKDRCNADFKDTDEELQG